MPSGHSEYDRLPSELQDLTGVLVSGGIYSPSNTILIEDNEAESTTGTSWVTKKTFYLPRNMLRGLGVTPNELRINLELKSQAGGSAEAQVIFRIYYDNNQLEDIVKATLTTSETTYQQKSTDKTGIFGSELGNLLLIKLRNDTAGRLSYLRNVSICGTIEKLYIHNIPSWSSD